jgi:single-strand DNA-binding protein
MLWRGLAELAQAYLRKGSLIFLEGKLNYCHYDDAQGQRHYVTEVVGEPVLLLDRKAAA